MLPALARNSGCLQPCASTKNCTADSAAALTAVLRADFPAGGATGLGSAAAVAADVRARDERFAAAGATGATAAGGGTGEEMAGAAEVSADGWIRARREVEEGIADGVGLRLPAGRRVGPARAGTVGTVGAVNGGLPAWRNRNTRRLQRPRILAAVEPPPGHQCAAAPRSGPAGGRPGAGDVCRRGGGGRRCGRGGIRSCC